MRSEAFEGVLIRDGLRTYEHRSLAGWPQQSCFAHLIRAAAELEREKSRGAVRFPRAVAALLRAARALARDRDELDGSAFAARRREIEAQMDRLLDERRHFTDPDNARLAKRLRRQRRHLFTFLELPEVEATNNRAERMIRPAVNRAQDGRLQQEPAGGANPRGAGQRAGHAPAAGARRARLPRCRAHRRWRAASAALRSDLPTCLSSHAKQVLSDAYARGSSSRTSCTVVSTAARLCWRRRTRRAPSASCADCPGSRRCPQRPGSTRRR